jgi:hypothetical protein
LPCTNGNPCPGMLSTLSYKQHQSQHCALHRRLLLQPCRHRSQLVQAGPRKRCCGAPASRPADTWARRPRTLRAAGHSCACEQGRQTARTTRHKHLRTQTHLLAPSCVKVHHPCPSPRRISATPCWHVSQHQQHLPLCTRHTRYTRAQHSTAQPQVCVWHTHTSTRHTHWTGSSSTGQQQAETYSRRSLKTS